MYYFYTRKPAFWTLTLLVCLSASDVSCLLALLFDKACSKIKASFFTLALLSLATVIPKNNVNEKNLSLINEESCWQNWKQIVTDFRQNFIYIRILDFAIAGLVIGNNFIVDI